MAIKKGGCLKFLLLATLLSAAVLWLLAEFFFNVGSNLVAVSVRDSKEQLEVRIRNGGWKTVTALTPADVARSLTLKHAEPGLRWSTLKVRRPARMAGRLAQTLLGAEVHVVVISPQHFEFMTTYLPKFAPTTASERMDAENLWFAINANFRDPKGRPLGWVWHEGRQVNASFPEWSGCFFVKGGQPYFGPKSLVEEIPGAIDEGTQGYPSVMKNHTVFSYVETKSDAFFDGTKISYRSLGGMRKDGSIVFVVSGDGGVMNVREVTELARKLDVQHATLLDGGRALQYSIRTEDGPWGFAAFNTSLNFGHRWLERQQSPVFIGVRRKAPEVIAVESVGAP